MFQNGAWSAQLPDITVFDDNFVAQNVCSGIEIETEHRQNLHELILGVPGVSLNATLQTYVTKVEEHNRIIREKEAAIPASVREALTVDAFCALVKNDNIDAAIQEAERSLAAANRRFHLRDRELIPRQITAYLTSPTASLRSAARLGSRKNAVPFVDTKS